MAKILIIEDDALVANTVAIVLRKAGHTVSIAANGKLGLERLAHDAPDLLITDIAMPGPRGVDVIKSLRSLGSQLPIIAISGTPRETAYDLLQEAKEAGANEVLRKPFANRTLLALVQRCLPE